MTLEINALEAAYGPVQILFGLSLTASAGEITCLMGRNGAGKSTTLKTIMGLTTQRSGTITLAGQNISTLPAHQRPSLGIGYVPQGRRLFGALSVRENLAVGLNVRPVDRRARLDEMLTLFPRLRERLHQRADTLSGGEQQMLAMARALCLRPDVLLLDEPSEGLQPSVVALLHEVIAKLKTQGVAVVLVEQRPDTALALADKVVFVENGTSPTTLTRQQLTSQPDTFARYLGV